MKRSLSTEQDIEVSRLYLQGHTQRELAKQFKVGAYSIESSLKRSNTAGRRTGYAAKDEVNFSNPQQIIDDYQEMKGLAALSKKYGSAPQLKKFLRAQGLLQKTNLKIEVNNSKILELYNKGLLFTEIIEVTGYSAWCIGVSLKSQGVDTRSRFKNQVEPFTRYKRLVRKYTSRSWKYHKTQINPQNLPHGRTAYHLDHIFSMSAGFRENIPPYIIGHYSNLQMLPYNENIKKSAGCSKSIDQLLKDVFN
jgi:transposase